MYDIVFAGVAQYPRGASREHRHGFWEMVYYLDCEGFAVIDGISYEFKTGSFFLIPPDRGHFECSEGEMHIVYLGMEKLFLIEERVYALCDNAHSDFLGLMKQVHTIRQLHIPNWKNILDALMNLLEQYILSQSGAKAKHDMVERLEHLLVSNVSKKGVNIDELIRTLPMSESQIRKLFRASTGKSPAEYLIDLRLNSAKQLLTSTVLSIKDVALSTGFADPYYFSRIFKKKTGEYPTAWRERTSR